MGHIFRNFTAFSWQQTENMKRDIAQTRTAQPFIYKRNGFDFSYII